MFFFLKKAILQSIAYYQTKFYIFEIDKIAFCNPSDFFF